MEVSLWHLLEAGKEKLSKNPVFLLTLYYTVALKFFLLFKGDMQPLDVCCVKRKNEVLRYSVVMAAYGFFGDVMQDSEKLRWMGPKRYDISGFKKFMSNK